MVTWTGKGPLREGGGTLNDAPRGGDKDRGSRIKDKDQGSRINDQVPWLAMNKHPRRHTDVILRQSKALLDPFNSR